MSLSTAARRGTLAVVASGLMALPLLASTPAGAASTPAGSLAGPALGLVATATCPADAAHAQRGHRDRAPDTAHVGRAELARIQQHLAPGLRKVSSARTAETVSGARLADHILLPVYVHVIKGSHAHEQSVSRTKVRRVMEILREGYRGAQSGSAYATRFSFTIRSITMTRNDRWYHAVPMSTADRQMRRTLHRGGARSLNLYINGLRASGGQLLGYSRFPWQYAGAPRMDGVTVHADSLPGGRFTHYNRGDTVIHEVGHWLGLFHTFERGCSSPGDAVADTPYEAYPATGCPTWSDTCPFRAGLDPVTNFLDYSYDSCMNKFTRGQSQRMDASFAYYRR